ncbi:hypothetical protein VPH35_055293 [Triticum aestivum]|nr:uncharacterized protein LOC123066389 [Triticum aestivum]
MDEHRGEMARWLDILVAKGVQELVFVNRPWPLDPRLPATLFSCASLTRLYLGIWRLPESTAVPRGARFPNLRELGLCMIAMKDRDLALLLERSPVLEFLLIMGCQIGVRLRLVSQSLRCLQLSMFFLGDMDVVDAPCLERLFQYYYTYTNKNCSTSRIKIGGAPNLRMLGYLEPGGQEFNLAGSKESIVQILGIEVQFGVRSVVKKVPGFLRCFPNLETLHVQSHHISEEPTRKVNVKFWLQGGPIKCVVESMRKVFLYEFRGSRSEVTFLKFVAERARVLEQMVVVVSTKSFSPGDDVSAKLKPLTNAKWASKACKLELFKSPPAQCGVAPFCHRLANDFSFPDPFNVKDYCEERIAELTVVQ